MSNITNENDDMEAVFCKIDEEQSIFLQKIVKEQEKVKMLKLLVEKAKKEKHEFDAEIIRKTMELKATKLNLTTYRKKLDLFEKYCTCIKNVTNGREKKGFEDSQGSSTNSEQFHLETKSGSTLAKELALLENVSNNSLLRERKSSVKCHPVMPLPNTDFRILKKMIQELVEIIEVKYFSPNLEELSNLCDDLSHSKGIPQVILTVGNIINILKLANCDTSATDLRNCSDVDSQIQALILDKTELKKENEFLTKEIMDVKKRSKFQLEMMRVKLQAAEKHCEELQASEKKLNADNDQVCKEAKESWERFKCAKQYIEKQRVENGKLMKMYTRLVEKLKSPCVECENMHSQIREMQSECRDWRHVNSQLKEIDSRRSFNVKDLEHQVKRLEREKRELEFKLRPEVAFSSGTLSDKEDVYLQHNKAMRDFEMKSKGLEKTRCFQGADEEDFLDHSSSAESDSEDITEDSDDQKSQDTEDSDDQKSQDTEDSDDQKSQDTEDSDDQNIQDSEVSNADDCLKELRQNTLCLPHLQSSYTLEIEKMTPTERKYYEVQQKISEGEREFCRKQEAQYLGNANDRSDSRESFTLNKRKTVVDISTNASKKVRHTSSEVSKTY